MNFHNDLHTLGIYRVSSGCNGLKPNSNQLKPKGNLVTVVTETERAREAKLQEGREQGNWVPLADVFVFAPTSLEFASLS